MKVKSIMLKDGINAEDLQKLLDEAKDFINVPATTFLRPAFPSSFILHFNQKENKVSIYKCVGEIEFDEE